MQRYTDPATEFAVVRLTDPQFASGLTAPRHRQFDRRSGSLLHWSERSGSAQAYLLDLKSGASRQLTDAVALDRSSLCLAPDDKSVYWFDGASLNEAAVSSAKSRTIYAVSAERHGFSVAVDGSPVFAEGSRIVRLVKQKASTVAEEPGVDLLLARPKQTQLLFRSQAGVGLINLDGSGRQELKLVAGRNEEFAWTPSGRSLIYLHVPEDPRELISLREFVPEDGTDREVARTSQFASVAANGDGSVFAGASRGKASAYVLILLRVTRRELTMCEHRASDARMVAPIFTPDSQSIVFVSDRHGKAALYRVQIEKFVEPTG